ncbi:VPLPA-CTERM sorting domain-containing protein [Thiohalobacter thiocyanaticus]|uniref:VPLPA-CTERM sorting domain-containing protein n=1 Tax=Thiohalobacter thiocyanaticus TaxID=585455 RepID=UPI0019D44A99|nr:VPLPA-CTERM sorting domain-containing protein [Thiohalobacter thiocyanaticus]
MKFSPISLPVLAALVLVCPVSQAAMITKHGTDVSFTFDDSTLFGDGTVVGSSIFFTPENILAESYDGAGIDAATDTLNLIVESTNSAFIMDTFGLEEQGDYRLRGAPSADVDASAYFNIISHTTMCGLFACSSDSIWSAGPLGDTSGALTNWSLGGLIDLNNTSDWGADTKVTVTLQNNLLASTTTSGDIAFIQKKEGTLGIMVNQAPVEAVPVPAAVWLFGSGLFGLVGIARRKAC